MPDAVGVNRFRTDIQALRGLAILLVLVYHARLIPQLKAGYLGVDIFFVVSGYLITGIVQRAVLAGTFTFAGFYFRRAKRLLPAAYVTLLATAIASPWFLTRPEMKDFTWQLLGAVTFTGNIVLWMQTGYFEGAANLKPLLHVWSLSIEEQYYLLLPAALVFTPRRFWTAGTFAIVVGSLLLCFVLLPTKPGAVFYLLPTRAWELALGSLGILALGGSMARAWLAWLFWPALAALLAVPFFPTGAAHPGLDALIVCTATLVIILRCHPVLNRGFPARGLASLGDISYSLYLVHWPLLAFAGNAWVSPVPVWVRAGLVGAALALAWALNRWIEDPIRKADIAFSRESLFVTLGASTVLVLAGFVAYHWQSWGDPVDFAYMQRANIGLGSCDFGNAYTHRPECQDSNAPKVLVWGDSFAMHLVQGIVASTDKGLVQATKSRCGPFLKIAGFDNVGPWDRRWAEGCLQFNRSVLTYLAAASTVDVVVLSGNFAQAAKGGQLLVADSDREKDPLTTTTVQTGNPDVAFESMRSTIALLRASGKRVVLVAPPPSSDFNIGRCLELKANGKTILGADSPSCAISEERYRVARVDVLAFLERVSRELDVPVVRFDHVLCDAGFCATELGGTFLYRDGGHFSVDGSRQLGRKMGLGEHIVTIAR